MLAIFFPHMFEDVEYLLPPEEMGTQPSEGDGRTVYQQGQGGATGSGVQENAVAGPSRLR